jgi:hypothetical protein
MADLPALSTLLPSDIVAKMKQEGGSDWLNRVDDLTQKAALGGLVLGGRQVPGADANVRRFNTLLENFGDRHLPPQLGLGSGGLTYTGDGYNVSASPSSIGIETGLLGGKLNMGVERTGSVKDMLNNLGFTARAKWEF